MFRVLSTIPLILVLTACGSPKVTEADYKNKWAFTVPEGELGCTVVALPGILIANSPKAVTLKHNGITYAINGAARTHSEKLGLEPLEGIWKDDGKGGKVPVPDELIAKGLEACN